MNKIKVFFKNIWEKIKKGYYLSSEFIIKNKIYFIIGLSTIILFILLLFLIKWYISLIITLIIDIIAILVCWKRGMFVKKKKRINETKIKIDKLAAQEIFLDYQAKKINSTEAARKLGISNSTFLRRYREYVNMRQ